MFRFPRKRVILKVTLLIQGGMGNMAMLVNALGQYGIPREIKKRGRDAHADIQTVNPWPH